MLFRFVSETQNRDPGPSMLGYLGKIGGFFLWDPKGVQSRNKNKMQINLVCTEFTHIFTSFYVLSVFRVIWSLKREL